MTGLFSNPAEPSGGQTPAAGSDTLFSTVLIPRHLAGPSLLASMALHAIGLATLPPALAALWSPSETVLAVEVARVEPLRLQVPEALYYAQPTPPPPARRARPAGASKGENTSGGSSRSTAAPRRRFRAPDVPIVPGAVQTLLQPQDPPDLRPPDDVRLPEFFLWAVADVPPPPLKEFVPPAPPRPSSATPVLAAPPRLDLPNYELPATDLKIGFAPAPEFPELPAEVSSVVPVQDEAAAGLDAMDVQMGLEQGEPYLMAALSLSPDPAPWSDELEVPPGNQLAPSGGEPADSAPGGPSLTASLAAPGGASESGAGSGRAAAGTTGAGGTANPSSAGASGGAGAAGRGNGTGDSEANEAVGTGGGPEETGTARGSGGPSRATGAAAGGDPVLSASAAGAALGDAGRAGPPAPATAIPSLGARRIVYPPDGKFDVVLIQATPQEAFGLQAGVLSGNPIYTAYIPIEEAGEWVMQYCIPAAPPDSDERGTRVVQLGNPAPLVAPYPKVAVVPSAELFPPDRRLPVHGFLSAEGRFEQLRILGDEPGPQDLLNTLEEWEFRPATRDAVPVRIEILLIIPPGGGLSGPRP